MSLMDVNVFKIIKIIDDYRVVINAGKNQYIKPGTVFEIFIKGVELKDDETGESYGTLDYIKGTVEVTNVFDKVSICKSTETYTESVPNKFFSGVGNLLAEKTTTYVKKLEVDQSQITGYGFDIDKTIKLGDLVRKRQE